VITAVGMVTILPAMVGAILIAVAVMIFLANPVGEFIDNNPTIKMLALGFIILVGVVLLLDGCGVHVQRGYLYFAMAFSGAVESLNLLAARRRRRLAEQVGSPPL
jgi:predicted tellurium resistance membrane protein TerC